MKYNVRKTLGFFYCGKLHEKDAQYKCRNEFTSEFPASLLKTKAEQLQRVLSRNIQLHWGAYRSMSTIICRTFIPEK